MIKMFPIALVFVSTAAVAEGQTLSGAEIRDKIITNTLVGTEDGAPVVEFFKDDGSILGRGSDGNYVGLWQIRGDKLCVHYEDDKAGSMDCLAIAINGDRVTRLSAGDDVDDDDNDDIWTLKTGNSENLAPAVAEGVFGGVSGGQTLSGTEIGEKIIHNTLVGTEDGAPVVEFFNDDGIIFGQGDEGKYAGLWRINGNKLCVAYDEDDDDKSPQGLDCMTVIMSGDKVLLLSADDDIEDADNSDLWTLKQGNPELLTSDTDDD